MIWLINTWQDGDASAVNHGGDYEACLKSIKAKGLIMPSKTDLYFPVRMSFFHRLSDSMFIDCHLFSLKTVKLNVHT